MNYPNKMQKAAFFVGVMFVAVGVLGFVPGVTTGFDDLDIAGHESGAKLLGLFQVSVLHNLVHMGYGLAGMALAKTYLSAARYFLYGGIIYLVLFLYGLVIDKDSSANFVPLNSADNLLHVGLGAGMIGIYLLLRKDGAGANDGTTAKI